MSQSFRRLTVTVSIMPQGYFVCRIAGDHARINVMVPPGASPATYEPSPAQMSTLSQSRVYFGTGVPFEASWMARIQAANGDMTIVNTSDCIDGSPRLVTMKSAVRCCWSALWLRTGCTTLMQRPAPSPGPSAADATLFPAEEVVLAFRAYLRR